MVLTNLKVFLCSTKLPNNPVLEDSLYTVAPEAQGVLVHLKIHVFCEDEGLELKVEG